MRQAEVPPSLGPVEQPRYAELARAIRLAIAGGELPAGHRLPGERELCRRFDVSRATVRRALGELADEGVLRSVGTRGWFVTGLVEPGVLMGFTDLAAQRGLVVSSRVLTCCVRPATLDEAEALAAPPGAQVLELERVRLMDGRPLGWQRAVAALWLAPSLAGQDYDHASLYSGFRADSISPTSADYQVSAAPADARQASLLGVPRRTCLLLVRAVTADQHGRPIETSSGAFLGDRYRFSASVSQESRRRSA